MHLRTICIAQDARPMMSLSIVASAQSGLARRAKGLNFALSAVNFEIPRPLKVEHEDLHEMLSEATKEPGELGDAAKAVAKVMHPHFLKEEEYALPLLGLLRDLAQGKVTPGMKEVLGLTDKLKAELRQMLEEHKSIVAALEKLSAAAKKADKMEYVEFARALMLHAQTEEDVSYPTAILIGEYVREKLRLPKP
jgi:hypothetical protein